MLSWKSALTVRNENGRTFKYGSQIVGDKIDTGKLLESLLSALF